MAYFDTRDHRHWANFLKLFTEPSFDGFLNWFSDWAISPVLILFPLYVGLLSVLVQMVPNFPMFAFGWIVGLAPIWLPIVLAAGLWNSHFSRIHAKFVGTRNPILLELKLPPDVTLSPRAMELAFNQLYSTGGETTFVDRFFTGKVRLWYSFELVSLGGEVHFYVWTWKMNKSNIENAFYTFFPTIEVVEVDDYALRFTYDSNKDICFATDWKLAPARALKGHSGGENAFPLRSYIDFELDKDPKEEFKVDPLSIIFEYLSSVKPNEQLWIQFLVRGHGNEFVKTGPLKYEAKWDFINKEAVADIRTDALRRPGVTYADPLKPLPEEMLNMPNPTWRQVEMIRTIERHYMKRPFDFMARGIYISNAKDFHAPTLSGLRLLWVPFRNQWMSDLAPTRWLNSFDYPWEDYKKIRTNLFIRRFLDAYRRRSAFYPPWRTPHNIVTAETLATLYHFPSRGVGAPGLRRMPSTKAEPPSNLPR